MGANRRLKLGFAVPVFAAPGDVTLRVPSAARLDWEQVRQSVLAAERLGYDSAWFSDHLFLGREGAFLESWSTLAYFAGCTSRIRLVPNHYNINFRHAPLIAKAAATLDLMTGGRIELFLSPGAREVEHTSYGFGWEACRTTRQEKLQEAVTVIRDLWRAEPTDFHGRHYNLDAALSAPAPTQGALPVWLGGPLDDVACALIARTADGWNALPTSLRDYAAQAEQVNDACRRIGRHPRTLRRSLETQVLVLDDELAGRGEEGPRLNAWFDRWDDLRVQESGILDAGTGDHGVRAGPTGRFERDLLESRLTDRFIIGTRAEVARKLQRYSDLGVDEVVCWFMDFPGPGSMVAVATDIRDELDHVEAAGLGGASPARSPLKDETVMSGRLIETFKSAAAAASPGSVIDVDGGTE